MNYQHNTVILLFFSDADQLLAIGGGGHFDPSVPKNEKCKRVYIRYEYCWVEITHLLPLFICFFLSVFDFKALKMMFY